MSCMYMMYVMMYMMYVYDVCMSYVCDVYNSLIKREIESKVEKNNYNAQKKSLFVITFVRLFKIVTVLFICI